MILMVNLMTKKKKLKTETQEVNIMNIFPSSPDGEEFEIEVSVGGRMFKGVISLDEDDIDETEE